MSKFASYNNEDDSFLLRNEIIRYISFWPYLLIILVISLLISFLYLRYTPYSLKTTAIIEILDESQNSEMALPTELTVFNRSMINLENEITRLNSYSLNSAAVKQTKTNIHYYTRGRIRDTRSTPGDWYDDYTLDFKIDTDLIDEKISFLIKVDNNMLEISSFDSSDSFIESKKFESLSTLNKNHNIPFDISINSDKNISYERELIIVPVKYQTNVFRANLQISPLGKDSDQLSLSLTFENHKIAQNYLNSLIRVFDNDGISDRELEYNRTITFVNSREKILKDDLTAIESRKQAYKQKNSLYDVNLDANNNIDLKSTYNSEIFELESQKQISEYIIELVSELKYDYLPINIGLENLDLTNLINDFNQIISQRNRYLIEASPENFLVKSLESQLDDLLKNISISLNNYSNSLDLKLNNLKLKESEFDIGYNRVPENEKILRSIERELEIKEALYLLLLQKREEASINLAVVKPTIKVIDYAITNFSSKSPNGTMIYLGAIFLSFSLYFMFLFLWFLFDNKIHNKDQLIKLLNKEIPLIAEIPFVKSIQISDMMESSSRSVISESIRMLLSNLRFTSFTDSNKDLQSQIILFTSSIKGEGKTICSVSTALALANDIKRDKKVILLGTDLRNPQIHKNFGVDKTHSGISEIIYNNDEKQYKKYIRKFGNLDVLFSGSIPPNPTAMLSSNLFRGLILLLKSDYDYIIIDSAPCLLVSDTFQFIDLADSVVYIFRSNFTDAKIVDFINETHKDKKIKNFNLVLNAVGNSAAYGYKYGYQYGYKYGYKYSYNYGYGYGYSSDE